MISGSTWPLLVQSLPQEGSQNEHRSCPVDVCDVQLTTGSCLLFKATQLELPKMRVRCSVHLHGAHSAVQMCSVYLGFFVCVRFESDAGANSSVPTSRFLRPTMRSRRRKKRSSIWRHV